MKLRNFFYLLLALPLLFAGCTEAPTDEPTKKEVKLELTSEATLTFDAEGGSGAIAFTLENAVEGVNATASCEADWVTDLTVENYVTFNVAKNEGEARSTKIVVAYQEKSFEVAVNQAAYEAPAPEYYMEDHFVYAQRISLVDYGYPYNYFYLGFLNEANTLILSGIIIGAENDTVLTAGTYTTENVGLALDTFSLIFSDESELYFEGGNATVVVEGDIEGYDIDFLIDDGAGKTFHFTFEGVIEDMDPFGNLPTEPVNFTATEMVGEYYGTSYSVAPNYYLVLSDIGLDESGYAMAGGTYYQVDLYSVEAEVDAEGYMTIPAGTYVFDANDSTEAWTMGAYYSGYAVVNAEGTGYEAQAPFNGGQAVVTADGITLTVTIGAAEHTVVYNGTPKIYVGTSGGGGGEAEINYAYAYYFGDQYTPDYADNFYFFLSDLGLDAEGYELPNGTYYRFDLYSPLCDGTAIPAGTYTIDMYDSGEPWTISLSYSAYYVMDEYAYDWVANDYPYAGTVVVGEDGSVTAEITMLTSGETHTLTYNGEIPVIDMSQGGEGGGDSNEINSNLTSDWNCNFSNHTLKAVNYGDWYEVGLQNWTLVLAPNDNIGDFLQLDLLADADSYDNFCGTYTISDSYSKYTAVCGEYDWELLGCWYYSSNDGMYYANMAPFVDGWVEILDNNDDTYTIEFEAWDDADYFISGKWTGPLTPIAEAYSAAKKSSKATASLVVAEKQIKSKENFRVVAPAKKSAANVAPKGLKLR